MNRFIPFASLAFLFVLIACHGDERVSPIASATISWSTCRLREDSVAWFAVQDGTGPWRQIQPVSGQYSFKVDSGRAGVAYVNASNDYATTWVRYYTALELQAMTIRCYGRFGTGKTVTGSVATLGSGEFAKIALTGVEAYVSSSTGTSLAFSIQGVANGSADLVAARYLACENPAACSVPAGMIIRRSLDIADGGSAGSLDFNSSTDAIHLVPQALKLTGLGADEVVSVFEGFTTATTTYGTTLLEAQPGNATTLTYYGVPSSRLATGDLHHVFVFARTSDAERDVSMQFHDLTDQTIDLGVSLAAVTVTSTPRTGFVTLSAKLARQPQFKFWGVSFQGGRAQSILSVSEAYPTSGDVHLDVPDFTGVPGWLSAWGLQRGVNVYWDVSALDIEASTLEATVPGSLINIPPSRQAVRSGKLTP